MVHIEVINCKGCVVVGGGGGIEVGEGFLSKENQMHEEILLPAARATGKLSTTRRFSSLPCDDDSSEQ